MTGPTPAPDLIFRLRRLADSTGIPPVKRRREVCNEAADALAAVTAERDQARKMLADAPHEGWCPQYHKRPEVTCMCWKAGL